MTLLMPRPHDCPNGRISHGPLTFARPVQINMWRRRISESRWPDTVGSCPHRVRGNQPLPQDTIRYKLVRLLDGPEAQECDRWLIAAEALDGNERVFRGVADAARDVGLPWMRKKTSLEALIYELRDGNGPWRRTPYLTAALWMKGEVATAEAWLAQIASQFGAPPPEIPEPLRGVRVSRFGSSAPPEGWPRHDFDAFATRLREGMAQYPEGPPEDWRPQPV